jgi:hypothetical protein
MIDMKKKLIITAGSFMIASCVFFNGSVHVAPVAESRANQSHCNLLDYEHLIVIPTLPDIPVHLIDDSVYVETALVKSIKDHRIILKALKEKIEDCKLTH